MGQAFAIAAETLATKDTKAKPPVYIGKVWLRRADSKTREKGRRYTSAAMHLQRMLSREGWRDKLYPTQFLIESMEWATGKG